MVSCVAKVVLFSICENVLQMFEGRGLAQLITSTIQLCTKCQQLSVVCVSKRSFISILMMSNQKNDIRHFNLGLR